MQSQELNTITASLTCSVRYPCPVTSYSDRPILVCCSQTRLMIQLKSETARTRPMLPSAVCRRPNTSAVKYGLWKIIIVESPQANSTPSIGELWVIDSTVLAFPMVQDGEDIPVLMSSFISDLPKLKIVYSQLLIISSCKTAIGLLQQTPKVLQLTIIQQFFAFLLQELCSGFLSQFLSQDLIGMG